MEVVARRRRPYTHFCGLGDGEFSGARGGDKSAATVTIDDAHLGPRTDLGLENLAHVFGGVFGAVTEGASANRTAPAARS